MSLGHAYDPIIVAVKDELNRGVNFQRPSYIEEKMAEEFLGLIPQHQMIKFAKNGSTATTAAVKLARAYTGRQIVVFPGDHPFYSYDDWFIGKTACDKGVPELFRDLTLTYNSLDLNTLEALFTSHPNQIACVISEPEKTNDLPENYVQRIIDLCHKNGALFIQDEMITGFKTDLPGSIKKLNVTPDLATWGKGIANGFSFCALTGKKEIMELGGIQQVGKEKVFLISSTHGGETHAMAAAIATIHEFKKNKVIEHNHNIGKMLIDGVNQILTKNKLDQYLEVSKTEWMQAFTFKDANKVVNNGFRTLFLQEMIGRGVLFQGAFVPCYSHNQNEINYFLEAFEDALKIYMNALESGFEKFLIGEPTKPVFRKYL